MTTTDGLRNAIEYALCDEFYEDYTSDGCLGEAEMMIGGKDIIDNINSCLDHDGVKTVVTVVNSNNAAKVRIRIDGRSSSDIFGEKRMTYLNDLVARSPSQALVYWVMSQ